jgi:hypothetical protein
VEEGEASMKSDPNLAEHVNTLLRTRLKERGLSQHEAARIFNRTRAWASQELFSEPDRALRRQLIVQPDSVEEFAVWLGWVNTRAMFADLGLLPESLTGTRAEMPTFPKVRFMGEIHAARARKPLRDRSLEKPVWIEIPPDILHPIGRKHPYNASDVFVVKVVGDSMTSPDVQESIPSGSFVAVHSKLEPTKRDIVAVWVTALGIDVLKSFNTGLREEVVLESYNPLGARFASSKYELRLQGVYIGHWMAGRRE